MYGVRPPKISIAIRCESAGYALLNPMVGIQVARVPTVAPWVATGLPILIPNLVSPPARRTRMPRVSELQHEQSRPLQNHDITFIALNCVKIFLSRVRYLGRLPPSSSNESIAHHERQSPVRD